jgi:exonuclease I
VDDGDGVEEKMDSLGVRITELKNKIDSVKQVMSTVLATRNSLEDARIKAQHARNYWAEENPAEAVKWSKYCRHLNKLLAYCDDYDRQKKEALAKEAEMQREELSTGGEDSNKSPEGGA